MKSRCFFFESGGVFPTPILSLFSYTKVRSIVRSLNVKLFQSLTSGSILSVFSALLIASTQLDWSSRTHTSLICMLFIYIISMATMTDFGHKQLTAPLFPLVNLKLMEYCLSTQKLLQKEVWEVSMSIQREGKQICQVSVSSTLIWETCRLICLGMAPPSIQQLYWLCFGNSSCFGLSKPFFSHWQMTRTLLWFWRFWDVWVTWWFYVF